MLQLRPMSASEYQTYMNKAVAEYASDLKVSERLSEENALKAAETTYNRLLPQGLQTEGQWLFSAFDTSNQNWMGMVWFGKKSGAHDIAFIYDINLAPEARGKGYGKILLNLAEAEMIKRGMSAVSLHVFGHNQVARQLYEKSGFVVTNVIMSKEFKK